MLENYRLWKEALFGFNKGVIWGISVIVLVSVVHVLYALYF